MTIFLAVLSITVLYFLFAFGGETIKQLIGRKVCAICAAVSLTWFVLLILKLLGFTIDILVIAVLMGQSIVGLMYKIEEYFKKKALPKFWLIRILIITGGTLFVYWLLKEKYFLLIPLLVAGAFLLIFVSSMISKKSSREINEVENPDDYKKAVSKLEEMMENCC